MKKILLFNPPTGLYRRDNRCQNRVEDQTVNVVFPPMELLYPAAVLEREGHELQVEDYPVQQATWENLCADLDKFQPDIALFTTTIATLESDLTSASVIKDRCSKTVTAAIGEPLNYLDREIIQQTPGLDLILRGETEGYLADFANDRAWDRLPSVTFMQGSEIVQTNTPLPPVDLDTLPFPARHLIDNDRYRSPETRNKLTTVVTSLGCPYQCIYCSVPALTGTRVRFRSPEGIVNELSECVERFGIHEFLFHADTFTLNKRWTIELCQRIVEQNLTIRWGCNSRVDTIDDERLTWMKKAGCWVIGFGVESGSDNHLERMKKGATADRAQEAIRLCRQHGIRSHAFFVFGFPWDTEESLRELAAYARELDSDFFDFNVVFPLPGTELDDILEMKNLVVRERLRHGGYAVGAVSTETLSAQDLERWRKKVLWRMYLRPRYILRTLKNAGSPAVAFNYLRAAWSRIGNLVFGSRMKRQKDDSTGLD